MSDTNFYPLKVQQIKQETSDTVSVFFELSSETISTFQFIQGQYLTLRFTINGQEERRAYSMSSSPLDKHLAVTVKRVEGGKVSNHIADNLKAGDMVDVMPPQGRFYTKLDPDQRKTYYLFGAGSGITPLMSILKTVIEKEPQSTVHLVYGSRHDDQIIFHDELEALESRYTGQLTVKFIVSQPKKEKTSFFKKSKRNWDGIVGRINKNEVGKCLDKNPVQGSGGEYFICGPGAMIDAVKNKLLAANISTKNIHAERFVNASEVAAGKQTNASAGGQVSVKLRGTTFQIDVPADKTILDALIRDKKDAPYSCMAAACSTCMAKVTKGEVKMDACYALDDDEVKDGYILACQSHPIGDGVEITFDI